MFKSIDMQSHEFITLQRQVRNLRIAISLFLIITIALFLTAFKQSNRIEKLRVSQLIIEDDQGRPVIVMGTGETALLGRNRRDSIHGIVLLDQKGDDRLYLGRETKLQMGGKLVERQTPGWSLLINEPGGDERAGFGFRDGDNAVGLGLDYGGKNGLEAIYLSAADSLAYIALNGDVARGHRDRIVLWSDTRNDRSMIKIGDATRDDKIVWSTAKGVAKIQYRDGNQRVHKIP